MSSENLNELIDAVAKIAKVVVVALMDESAHHGSDHSNHHNGHDSNHHSSHRRHNSR